MSFNKFNIKKVIAGSWLHSEFIRKNFLYFVFLLGLGLIYISNRYSAETLIIKSHEIREDIKKLRSEYAYYTEKLMQITTELQIEKLAKQHKLGIELSKTPPITIYNVKKKQKTKNQ